MKAKLFDKVTFYPYTLAHQILNVKIYHPCCKESILIKKFNIQTLNEFLDDPLNKKELEYLNIKEKQKIVKQDDGIKISQSKQLEEHFYDIFAKQDKNFEIVNAFLDRYPQASIANYLNLSKSLISKIIKSGNSFTGV